jgi:hypothetical protein
MKEPVLFLLTSVIVMSGCASMGSGPSPAAFSGSSSNSTSASASDSSTALKEVEAAERARFKAWIAADPAAMRPLLGDDLVYCHSTGQCQNKEEIVAAIASRDTIYHAMDIVYMKPRLIDGAVVINGKLNIRAESGGKVTEFQGIYTDVYAKRNGRWQMVSWQSTRVP